ncbi:hypothetical protein ILP92_03805 [Maribius pontilimi]|uniref:Uncharacterized protein n=1 Tax=Palleronia pontilimi TaxID=1964209 RepID=A0A934IA48_9RHOB|nr:hypothetical protein [Palleronia pontilimi]MBJ3761871.1 hypothetical protein [Palleronia pontilimi]
MQDITELQRRLAAALERIGAGLDGLTAVPDAAEASEDEGPQLDAGQLAADLEAERALVAQLEERLAANRDKSKATADNLQAKLDALQAQLSAMEEDRGRLKAVNDALRDSNQALREANEAGVGDGALINTAMQTELDALRQVRQSDRAELDAVLGLLAPALEDVQTQDEEAEQDA